MARRGSLGSADRMASAASPVLTAKQDHKANPARKDRVARLVRQANPDPRGLQGRRDSKARAANRDRPARCRPSTS